MNSEPRVTVPACLTVLAALSIITSAAIGGEKKAVSDKKTAAALTVIKRDLAREIPDPSYSLVSLRQLSPKTPETTALYRTLKITAHLMLGEEKHRARRYQDAIGEFNAADDLCDQKQRPDEWAKVQWMLANSHDKQRNVGDALRVAKSLIEHRRRTLGADHADTTACAKIIAELEEQKREREPEKKFLQRDWIAKEVARGKEHSDTTSAANAFGVFLIRNGDLDEAQIHFGSLLESREKTHGIDDPDARMFLGNLAAVVVKKGEFKEASQLLERLFEAEKRVLGENELSTTYTAFHLAQVYTKHKEFSKARPLAEHASKSFRDYNGELNIMTSRARDLLEEIKRNQ